MPRNGQGVYSKPPNTTAQPNTTIQSAMFNAVVDDYAADANAIRPVAFGGTGGNTPESAQVSLSLDNKVVYVTKSANYTAVKADNNAYMRFTAAATLALTAVATLGANWHLFVHADGGDLVIDPNGSEQINGATTITLKNGESALIISTGTAFVARVNSKVDFGFAAKSANYTALASDNLGVLRFTAAATLSLTAAATLGSGWRTTIINASSGDVVIDPNGSETINGAATLIISPGQTAFLVCDGAAFYADVHGNNLSGPQLQGFSVGLGLSTNATDTANDIDIAVGSAASDTSPYYLMQLTSALTKRIDAAWAVGTNQGGLDTGAVGNNTYYIWLIQRSDTGVVDALFSLSATAPTMPANYDRKRLIGSLIRASAANGAPASSVAAASEIKALLKMNMSVATPSIVYGKNVASLTDNGVGDIRVNFATPLPDADYIMVQACRITPRSGVPSPTTAGFHQSEAPTASYCRVEIQADGGGGNPARVDPDIITLAFIR